MVNSSERLRNKRKITVGPQASSVLVFLTWRIFKTSTLEACGPTVIFRLFRNLSSAFLAVVNHS